MGSLLLDVGSRNNLSGEMEPFAQVVETLGGQGVVVVLPRELGLDIAAGVERLASLDDKEVLGVDIGVLGKVEVLLGDEDTLSEEVLDGNVSLSILRFLLCAQRRATCQRRPFFRWWFTSWIFLRSALGINIVAVVLLERVDVGRWQVSEGRRQISNWITFVGGNPTRNSA